MKKVITVLSLILFTCFMACNSKEAKLKKLQEKQAEIEAKIKDLEGPVPVTVLRVKPETFRHYIEVPGKVDFAENVLLSPKVPGILTSLQAKRGARVSKGQLLATIDASVLEQSIAELEPEIQKAQTVFAEQQKLRNQRLGNETQYLTAKAHKKELEDKLTTFKKQREDYDLKAPISGIVQEVFPKKGEAVAPGAGIIRIVNPAGTTVVAEVPENSAARIKSGNEALIFFPALKKEVPAIVRIGASAFAPSKQTFTANLDLKDPAAVQLSPNMQAVVKINDRTQENAVILPENLILKEGNAPYVYLAEQAGAKHIATRRPITLGQQYEQKVEILKGISEDDKVISSNLQELKQGREVQF